MRNPRRTLRRTAAAGAVLALSGTFAACGGGDEGSTTSGGGEGSSMSESPMDDSSMSESPQGGGSAGGGSMNASSQVFGPGCKLVPKSGDGSFDGMATAPVATAASANPLLKTLVKAVGQAGLVDTLNSAKALTVFAPTDDAFAKIPKKDMNAVMSDKKALTTILSHHVVEGKLGPDQVAGQHKTLAGDMIQVKGSGEKFTVGKENAAVLCGNVPTANATVYVIDTVMMPSSM